jgi:hypothetical protein
MNAWVEQYLHPWTSSQPHIWARMLPIAEFAHNNVQLIEEHLPAATDQIKELIKTRNMTQERLNKIQSQHEDHKTPEFAKRDQVWLEARNLKITGNQKLMPKQYGPY